VPAKNIDRALLLVICGAFVGNRLLFAPLLEGWSLEYTVRSYFALGADYWGGSPRAVEILVQYLMIVALVVGVVGTRRAGRSDD